MSSITACVMRALTQAIEPTKPSRWTLNPLTTKEVKERAAAFGLLFATLQREIIELAFLGQGKGDLLDAEREPSDGGGELPNLGAAAPLLEGDGLRHGLLAFCDALKDELLSAEHGDSFVNTAAPAADGGNATKEARRLNGRGAAIDDAGPFTGWESSIDDLCRVIDQLADRLRHQDVMLSQVWNRIDGGAA